MSADLAGMIQTGMIQTVRGLIHPPALGVTDCHSHVYRGMGELAKQDASFLLDDYGAAVKELHYFRRVGGNAIVDMTPCGPDRNLAMLSRVSLATGVHIVAVTGFVDWALSRDSSVRDLPVARLAELLVGEIHGVDSAWQAVRGSLGESTVSAGAIKVSLEHDPPSDFELRSFEATAQTHLVTGAPIVVHSNRGRGCLPLIDRFAAYGVNESSLLISHAFQGEDLANIVAIAQRGTYLVADGPGKAHYDEARIIRYLRHLVDAGLEDRILLGLDGSKRTYWKAYGGQPGLGFVPAKLAGTLVESGIAESTVNKWLVTNPAVALSFRTLAG